MDHYEYLTLITFLSGIAGGVGYYILKNNTLFEKGIIKSVFIGMLSAWIVPLFLHTISSNLIDSAKEDPLNYYVYAGLCIIAAMYSKKFFETVSDKVLKNSEEAKKIAEEAKSISSENAKEIETVVSRESESEEAKELDTNALNIPEQKTLEVDIDLEGEIASLIKKVLKSYKDSKFVYRTVTGISKDSGLKKEMVEVLLDVLVSNNLAISKLNKTGKYKLWALTEQGREITV